MKRHVRQYASSVGLNTDDEESSNITSYSTRVERVHKPPRSTEWVLTLRRLTTLTSDNGTKKVKVDWWEERFDAVVLASNSESDSAFVPNIPGLREVAEVFSEVEEVG